MTPARSVRLTYACCFLASLPASVGFLDIALAIAALLVYPLPAVHAWCAVWGFATALMRPLSGESIHQFIERSGNFLPAVALLYLETKRPAAGDFSFEQWLYICAATIAAGFAVSALLRVTKILADREEAKKQ